MLQPIQVLSMAMALGEPVPKATDNGSNDTNKKVSLLWRAYPYMSGVTATALCLGSLVWALKLPTKMTPKDILIIAASQFASFIIGGSAAIVAHLNNPDSKNIG